MSSKIFSSILSGLFSKFWSPFSLAVTHASVPSMHSEPVVSIYGIYFEMENDCNIGSTISEMILNFDT